ncbi:MAG: carboxypeptidase regulatory-like domain-containing protein, partial [Candidatus Eremiobacteraeota bacterium]|nr:carboxypeptidase regulatory-like domain-containing protein [Candidatus Eremiobacteraeota bacterium]
GCGSPHGLAFQLRLDEGAVGSGFSTTLRSVPNDFLAWGTGQINSDKFADLNYHGGLSPTLYADANWERTGNDVVGTQEQFVETLNLGGQMRRFGYSFSLMQQDQNSFANDVESSSDISSTQVQISTALAGLQTVFGAQVQRAIQSGAPSSTRAFAASLSRQIGLQGGGAIAWQYQRQTQAGFAPTSQMGIAPSYNRSFGKTSLQFSYTIQRTWSPTSDATQKTPLLTIGRQISPAFVADVTVGFQSLTDKLNPSANGRSRIFSLQLNSPFAFGYGATTGRVDPRLPAIIAGRVQVLQATSTGTYVGFSGAGGGGLSNAAVILDDRYVQRTDLTGGFQFSFVSPGQHQLRIDPSSLPRGVTVTTPVVTIVLQGGQTAQVLFQVGNFGGILGHVYGLDPSGDKTPLSNVRLRVDGAAYSQTDSTGAYGFGGLKPGKHVVEVIENTIPAFASFDPAALKQSVDVSDGQYSTLDFNAQPLGSISGKIVYAPDVASEGLKGGVSNAYVVAEPGEHAAIDDFDGSYIIDNLPPGHYTVSVDPETIEGGYGASPASAEVDLAPGAHSEGTFFVVGRFEKKVVFSLMSGTGQASAPIVHLSERRLPPRGTTPVTIDAPESARSVSIAVFDRHVALTYDKSLKAWSGEVAVPATAKAGNYSVVPAVASGSAPPPVTLTVDPAMPLAILQYTPAHPSPGALVRVHARFLVDVAAGDKIDWEDGQVTVLSKPVTGRVFTFDVDLSLRPLHGTLLTQGGRLPIEIL